MTLNVTSVFLLVQEYVFIYFLFSTWKPLTAGTVCRMTPLLSKNATVADPSRVITTSSVAGIKGFSTGDNATYSYSASKAAIMHVTLERGRKKV